jgi:hypothetical protein
MTMKHQGRVVWLAWFMFRGDPLIIVTRVLKEILQPLSLVSLYFRSFFFMVVFHLAFLAPNPWLFLNKRLFSPKRRINVTGEC